MVTVTLYVPASKSVAEVICGFCKELVKELGPVQFQVGVPDDVVVAFNCKDSPSQIALLLVADGAGGGFGSTKLNGPTGADGQLVNTTYTLEYVPDGSDGIVTTPLELLDIVAV